MLGRTLLNGHQRLVRILVGLELLRIQAEKGRNRTVAGVIQGLLKCFDRRLRRIEDGRVGGGRKRSDLQRVLRGCRLRDSNAAYSADRAEKDRMQKSGMTGGAEYLCHDRAFRSVNPGVRHWGA